MSSRRQTVSALVVVATVAVAVVGPLGKSDGLAASYPAESGQLTMTGESGHPLGRGQRYSFPASALEFGATTTTEAGVEEVTLRTVEGGFWSVRLSAPEGSRLQVGEYVDTRDFDDEDDALIAVADGKHGCGSSMGRFRVHDIDYGPRLYVRSLHVSFEQYCAFGNAPLRGEIDVAAAPPPHPLRVDLTFAPNRRWVAPDRKSMGLHGTITCSQAVRASVYAQVREVNAGGTGSGSSGSGAIECSSSPAPWFVPVSAQGGITFSDDQLRISVGGEALDRWYTDLRGTSVFGRDSVTAEVQPRTSSSSRSGATSRAWLLIPALAIIAVAGWSVLVRRWLRGRSRPISSTPPS